MIYNNPKIMKEHWIRIKSYEEDAPDPDIDGEIILLFDQKNNRIQSIMTCDICHWKDEIYSDVFYYKRTSDFLPNKYTDIRCY